MSLNSPVTDKKYHREFAREVMQKENNPIERYLSLLIEMQTNSANIIYDTERTEIHNEIMELFGFDKNDEMQYMKTKYIFGNIDKIIVFYVGKDISERLVRTFYSMMNANMIISNSDFEDICRFITMFLVEPTVRKFIFGELKEYEGVKPYDQIWIDYWHEYYARKWKVLYKWKNEKQ